MYATLIKGVQNADAPCTDRQASSDGAIEFNEFIELKSVLTYTGDDKLNFIYIDALEVMQF